MGWRLRDIVGDIARRISALPGVVRSGAAGEQSYREIYENAVLGIFRTTIHGRLISANPAFARILGYSDSREAVKSLTDIRNRMYIDPNRRDVLMEALDKDGFVQDFEAEVQCKDGTPIWIALHARVIRSDKGEAQIIEGTITDIDRRKQAERELTELNRTLQRQSAFNEVLLKAVPTPVFFKDSQGRYLGCNRAFTEFMGVTPEQIQGKTVYELWPGEHAKVYHEKDLELLNNPERQVYEFKVKDKDGVERNVIYSKDVFYDETGKPMGIVGGFLDITQRMKAEQELANMNRRLEQLVEKRTRELERQANELAQANLRLTEMDELKSAFLSSVSHELRTPLTSVLGFAKLIHKEFVTNYGPLEIDNPELAVHGQRIVKNLKILEHEGARLTRLINDLLDLSKIESGRIEWNDAENDVAELIGPAVDALNAQFERNPGVELVVDVAEDVPRLMVDKDRFHQVLINLLSNAAKFTQEGEVRVRAVADDNAVCIEVQDTGEGIPAEDHEKIFDKFHQVRRGEMRTEKGGTGLGLAICRQIVQHYGGTIQVESEPGCGSTFRVELPLNHVESSSRTDEEQTASGG